MGGGGIQLSFWYKRAALRAGLNRGACKQTTAEFGTPSEVNLLAECSF